MYNHKLSFLAMLPDPMSATHLSVLCSNITRNCQETESPLDVYSTKKKSINKSRLMNRMFKHKLNTREYILLILIPRFRSFGGGGGKLLLKFARRILYNFQFLEHGYLSIFLKKKILKTNLS